MTIKEVSDKLPTPDDLSRAAFTLVKEIGGNDALIACYQPDEQVELQEKLQSLNESLSKVVEFLLAEAKRHG